MDTKPDAPDVMTKGQAALYLSLSAEELDRLIDYGVVEVERVGAITWVRKKSVLSLCPMPRSPGVVKEGTISIGRREFVKGLVTGMIVNFLDRRVTQPIELAIAEASSVKPGEMVEQLLGLRPAPLSVSYGSLLGNLKDFHPDNRAGGNAIFAALINAQELRIPLTFAEGRGLEIDQDENILVAGGPVGCNYSCIAFEFEGPDSKHLDRRLNPIVPLRWYGIANEADPRVQELGHVAYSLESVGEIYPNNWPLIDTLRSQAWEVRTGARVHRDSTQRRTYWLEDNYLTVTRLPNFLSRRGADLLRTGASIASWPQLVVLDGRNGLGTRGAELLTQKAGERALRDALQAVGSFGPAYQVLFRLTHVTTDRGFSRFTSIEFIDAHEVRITKEILDRAYSYAQERLNTKYI